MLNRRERVSAPDQRPRGLRRRTLLKLPPAFLVVTTFGCAVEPTAQTDPYFIAPTYKERYDAIGTHGPIGEAAALLVGIRAQSGEVDMDSMPSTAGLFDVGGKLHIVTANHVSRFYQTRGHTSLAVAFPGPDGNPKVIDINLSNPSPEKFSETIKGGIATPDQPEGITAYPLSEENARLVNESITAGWITPLKISIMGADDFERNAAFGLVDPTQPTTRLSRVTRDANGFVVCSRIGGRVCDGQSGSAILRYNGQELTNEAVGIISHFSLPREVGVDGKVYYKQNCGNDQVAFVPFSK